MTKAEMIEAVLRTGGLTKANVERFYDVLVELAKRRLATDGEFVLPGLGILVVRTRKAREGRNPRTGETIRIGRRKTVRFRSYREIRLLLNPDMAEDEADAEGQAPENPSPGHGKPEPGEAAGSGNTL